MRIQGQFLDLQGLDLRNARLFSLTADPTGLGTGDLGRVWYDSTNNVFKGWNGTGVDRLTNLVESVAAADSSLSVALASKTATITLAAASGSQRGTMSAAHFSLVNAATPTNTASALVQRDASGNFAAGTITATLTGTASNASQLNGQAPSYYLNFANSTGSRDHTAINDFLTTVYGVRHDQLAAPTSAVAWGSQRLTSLADPTNPQDAATKNYVDSVATGLTVKSAVKAATTAALPAYTYANGSSGVGATLTATANAALPAIDGYSPAVNDRLLIKNESSAAYNGIYVVTQLGSGSAPFILTRSSDDNSASTMVPGSFTFVENGTTNAGSGWVFNTTVSPVVVGSTAINWVQFSSGAGYTAGNGITMTGGAISVLSANANRIAVSGTGVDISASYVGQTSITTLGTVTTGTWQGGAIGIAYGGTGATTAAGARTALAVPGKYAAALPALSANTGQNVVHNLNTTDIHVMVIDQTTLEIVYMDYVVVDVNTVKVTSGSSTSANAYRIVVLG